MSWYCNWVLFSWFSLFMERSLSLSIKSPCSELFWSAFFTPFPAFGLKTESYSVPLRIQSKCPQNAGKMRTRITSNTDAFYVVFHSALMTGYSVAVRLQIARESRLAIFPKFSWIFSKSLPKFLVGFPEIFRTATF